MSAAGPELVAAALPEGARRTLAALDPEEARACHLEDLGVSSLETVEMVEALEQDLEVEFEVEELLELMELTLGQLGERVQGKLAARAAGPEQPGADDGSLSPR